jgi:hypothetical protein
MRNPPGNRHDLPSPRAPPLAGWDDQSDKDTMFQTCQPLFRAKLGDQTRQSCNAGVVKMKMAVFLLIGISLSGCAGINKSMTYSDVKHVAYRDPSLPIGFWIFDRPDQGKMLINQDPGTAMGAGFAKGLTLGIADTSTPVQVFRNGAQLWLNSTGRRCKVVRVDRVLAPTNFEATYECSSLASENAGNLPS